MTIRLEFSLKDNAQLSVKSLVGFSGSSLEYSIIEKQIPLSKYYSYVQASEANYVQFMTPYDPVRIADWLQRRFQIGQLDLSREIAFKSGEDAISVKFDRGQLSIQASSLEVAQEVVQDYCSHFKVPELDSQASFMSDRNQLASLINQVAQLEQAYRELTIGMADDVNVVKSKIVQAEDCRIQKNYQGFREALGLLGQVNGQLFGEFMKRSTNLNEQANLSNLLRQYVRWTSNLKAGMPKQRFLSSCSEAYKNKDFAKLSELIDRSLSKRG
mmetsp:Transcript_6884/g.12544  ORF Transcript_6884/g.12544 Transcript_6884/m.12544 type:complete len:271 (+) Transcript_6884:1195-2007(+)